MRVRTRRHIKTQIHTHTHISTYIITVHLYKLNFLLSAYT